MEKQSKKRNPETLVAQGFDLMDETTRSLTPPIYPSTTFLRNPDLSYHNGRKYIRADNPTYDQVSGIIAELEGGTGAQLFSSGMAAIGAVLTALKPGDHIVAGAGVYGGTRNYLDRIAGPWGLDYTHLADNNPASLISAIIPGRTKIVWIETPSNPLWLITDIAAFCTIAHQHGCMVVADNTVATPVLTKPIDLGADIVMHSATKYLNGHGDILMGVLVTKEKNRVWEHIIEIAHDGGAIPGTFETWLLHRGIRTLFLRMERICSNAQIIAEYLDKHPAIAHVYYPGLAGDAGHEIAAGQMKGGFGGMISIQVRGGMAEAVKVQAKTDVFKRATSLGTTESLIEHRASYEGAGTSVPDDLLRLSIGIEDVEDLVQDLDQALSG